MIEMLDAVPWSIAMPCLVIVAFGAGVGLKCLQDRAVETVRRTMRHGDPFRRHRGDNAA